MTEGEALRLVAMLTAYFRQETSDETGALWARELTGFEIEDGMEAAQILGQSRTFMPSLAEFSAVIRDCRNVRVSQRSLPHSTTGVSFGEWFATQDDAMKARCCAVFPGLMKKFDVSAAALEPDA